MFAATLGLGLLLAAGAEAPKQPELAAVRAHVARGEELFAQGELGAAIFHFRAAEEVRPTPEVAYNLGKAYEKLNDAAHATYYYRLYLDRNPSGSDALEVAASVGEALAKAEQEGQGLLEVEAVGLGVLEVDGKRIPAAPAALFLPAGDYDLHWLQAGIEPRTQRVSILTGRVQTVMLEPSAAPLISAPGITASDSWKPSLKIAGKRSSILPPLGFATAGLGVAALIAGTVAGFVANSEAKESQTQPYYTDAIAFANRSSGHGLLANVLLGAGAVALIGGGAMVGIGSAAGAH